MKFINIWNQKGGVGKSTLTIQLAGAFASAGYKTAVLDLDAQKTCVSFSRLASSQSKQDFLVYEKLPKNSKELDIILCDYPPERSAENDPKTQAVLIPIAAGAIDAWATLPAIKAMTKRNPNAELFLVVNKFKKSRKFDNEFIEKIEPSPVSIIAERSIYARTIAEGGTVHKPAFKTPKSAYGIREAKKELDGLVKTLIKELEL